MAGIIDRILDILFVIIMFLIAVLLMIYVYVLLTSCDITDTLGNGEEVFEQTEEIQCLPAEIIQYPIEQIEHDVDEVELLAKTVWGEARGCSTTEQSAVVWCILNRVDDKRFPNDITSVVTYKNQFTGYKKNNPVCEEYVDLVNDVLTRWVFEKTAVGDVGRVIPSEYCWFSGNGSENIFRNAYNGDYSVWDWSLASPYKE